MPNSKQGAVGEKEPTAIAMKQKPAMRTWPSRFIRIKDKSLLVFANQTDYSKWEEQQDAAPTPAGAAAPPAQEERHTSITDLTGCKIIKGVENFTFGGDYFKLSVYSPNHETLVASGGTYNPELPGFNERKDKEAFFCFQAEYDCQRFLAAVSDLFFCNT